MLSGASQLTRTHPLGSFYKSSRTTWFPQLSQLTSTHPLSIRTKSTKWGSSHKDHTSNVTYSFQSSIAAAWVTNAITASTHRLAVCVGQKLWCPVGVGLTRGEVGPGSAAGTLGGLQNSRLCL